MIISFPKSKLEEVKAIFNKMASKFPSTEEARSHLIINSEIELIKPDPEFPERVVPMMSAEIIVPNLGDYKVIAKLDHLPTGNVISNFSGKEIDEKYRHSNSFCDHCGINRLRNETWLVSGKNDEIIQVGSSCIQEFTGAVWNPVFFKWINDFQKDAEEWGMSFGRGRIDYKIEDFLNITYACIKKDGWIPRSSGRFATVDQVCNYLSPPFGTKRDPNLKVPEEIHPLVIEALVWIRALDKSDISSDYMHNLKTLCSLTYVEQKGMGIVCSLMSAYLKIVASRQEKVQKKESEYVGKIGERRVFSLTLKRQFSFDGSFGTVFTNVFEDVDGNAYKWKTSNSLGEIEIGDLVVLKGTIKSHEIYENKNSGIGTKQTVLTRCTIQ